jgi:hypothetical protein
MFKDVKSRKRSPIIQNKTRGIALALLISYKCYAILLASSTIIAFSTYVASESHYWRDILSSVHSFWVFFFWILFACYDACRFRKQIVAADVVHQPALDVQDIRQKLLRRIRFHGHGFLFFVILWMVIIFIQGSWIHKILALVAFFLNVKLTILLLCRKRLIQLVFKDIVLVKQDPLLQENCSICLDNQEAESFVKVPCSHYFHSKCIKH